MSRHQYPNKTLAADYLRSALGVFLPLALIFFTELLPLVFYSMAALALLFAAYGIRTAWRQGTVLTVDDNGVRQEGPLKGLLDRAIRWPELRDIRLRYYSTRRDHAEGWMQLILRGPAGRIRMDSHLPGFEDIVRRACEEVRERGLPTDPATAANLASLGLSAGDGTDGGAPDGTATPGAKPPS